MHPFHVKQYVKILENRQDIFKLEELVTVCKRDSNLKRDYLFVNPTQGKHLPVNPSKTLKLFNCLAEEVNKITNKDEKVMVIGFAETATAIGRQVASRLPNCIYRTQTTRENFYSEVLVNFEEEHSHATAQRLYGNVGLLKDVDRIIFVEDEITTGNTILNLVKKLRELTPNMKFTVASILNWQDEESQKLFSEFSIETTYLVKGILKNLKSKVPAQCSKPIVINSVQKNNVQCTAVPSQEFNYLTERLGGKSKYWLNNDILSAIRELRIEPNDKVLVIGTEEYMFMGLKVAEVIERKAPSTYFQATTRSPIGICGADGYAIKSGYTLPSIYDTKRTTYLYNLEDYTRVVIVTDVIPNQEFLCSIQSIIESKTPRCCIDLLQIGR